MWLMLIDKSMKEWKIDYSEINRMLQSFDPETNRFN